MFETSFWDLIGAKENCSKFKLTGLLHPQILVGNDSSKTSNRADFSELYSQTSFLPSSPANQLQFSLTSCGVEGKGGLLSERIRIIMLFGKVELKYSRRQSARGLSHSEKDSQIRFVII